MESVPPSYEEATNKDYLTLIAPHLGSRELCVASLICKKWNLAFVPRLWGRPASHFGLEGDRIYVALTRFKRNLPRVRLQVRELTHTLHLPPGPPELYGGPHARWLRDILLHLPNLQSLIVSSLSSFDHAALSALRYDFPKSEGPKTPSIFPLRLLIAPNCTNTTSRGLDTALSYWPNLVFMDLSDTPAARDASVLSRLRALLSLQVVKLRHVDLRDQDLEVIADAISTRVRSLDVQDNRLTDASIRKLLSTCFDSHQDGGTTSEAVRGYRRSFEGSAQEDPSLGARRNMGAILDEFVGEDLDQRFIRRLTSGNLNRLPSEELPPPGLTHLYLANNLFSIQGVASLLRTGNLHVLDIGEVDSVRALSRPGTGLSLTSPQEKHVDPSGAEKLTPVLGKYGAGKLTYLRIHHQVVTKPTPEVPVVAELKQSAPTALLEPDTTEAPMYEPGDAAPAYEVNGNATSRSSSDTVSEQAQDKLRQKSGDSDRGLVPSALPKLRTLVLTNVPCTSNGLQTVDTLKRFISDCAEEYWSANRRAWSDGHALYLTGNSSSGRHRSRPEHSFALRSIILEMATSQEATVVSPRKPAMSRSSTKRDWSSTEDPDTEALWAAAENDFSFFGDDERRLPHNETELRSPRSKLAENMSLPADSTPADPQPLSLVSSKPTVIIDTVQELAAFRKERKAAFELARRGGEANVKGYWPGDVKVIRPSKEQKGFVNDYMSPFLM